MAGSTLWPSSLPQQYAHLVAIYGRRGRYELSWRAGFAKSRQELSLAGLDDLVLLWLNEPKATQQVSARQYALYQKLGTGLSLTRSIDYGKLSLQYFAIAEGTAHKLATDLSLHELGGSVRLPSMGTNDLHQYEGQLSAGLGLKYKGISRLELSARLPLVARAVRVAGKDYRRLNVLPSLRAIYEFNPRYSLTLDISTRASEQDILQEASGYILSSRHYLRQGSGRSLSSYAAESMLLLSIRYPREGHFYTLWHRGEYEHQRELARLEYLGGGGCYELLSFLSQQPCSATGRLGRLAYQGASPATTTEGDI